MEYVKHPLYPPEKLDGKRVAVCESGHIETAHFRVGKVRDDGFHELSITLMDITPLPNSGGRITGVPVEVPMDQDSVNKIAVPEADSVVGRLGCAFAIVQDAESESLVTESP